MGTRISLRDQLIRKPELFHKKQVLMHRWLNNAARCKNCEKEMMVMQRIDTPEDMKRYVRTKLRLKIIYWIDECRECEIESWWEKLKENGIVKEIYSDAI